nr:hypothetical protein [uncultured Sphingomonas sp.]
MQLFAGSFLSTYFLEETVRETLEYQAVDLDELRSDLGLIFSQFPRDNHPNESQTEDDLIWPILRKLGWSDSLRQQNLSAGGRLDVPDGLLFIDSAAKARANNQVEEWRRYEHGAAVIESKRWARPLDRAVGRDDAIAPSTQMLRYLRRIGDNSELGLRWGLLTNGARWRLYWAGARSVSEEFFEVDLAGALGLGSPGVPAADEAARGHALKVFGAIFSRAAFIRTGADGRSFHERARAAATFYEERVGNSLSKLVFEDIFPGLCAAVASQSGDAPLHDVRDASLILLYRVLFLLYAEDRELLPVNAEGYGEYALRPKRIEVAERFDRGDAFSTGATQIWSRIADLCRIVDLGDPAIGIPPYNGGLFAPARTPLLEQVRLPDSIIAPLLDKLSFERDGSSRSYINYRDLTVQQLGSIYERLLEHEVVRGNGIVAVQPNAFARKGSGSYYTPDGLVSLILEKTLEPLFGEARTGFAAVIARIEKDDNEGDVAAELNEADPAAALLKLRICDPAMGSGHFLVSLVDLIADKVLEAMAEATALAEEAGYDHVSPVADEIAAIRRTILRNARDRAWDINEAQLDDRHIVRRMVLKRCVYGVDKNPMAVELAKVSLWLHTFTVGAPLSFIDHHLRCGDSLFGLGVRDAIETASNLGGQLLWHEALRNAHRSAEAMRTIESLTDAEIGEAHRSAKMWSDVELMTGELDSFVSFMHALDWLDLSKEKKGLVRLWLDGRFGDAIPIARGRKEPQGGKAKPQEVEAFRELWRTARRLIEEERFFNWQIAFPGVWQDWESSKPRGGFDAIVGNPPWDRFEFEEIPWFAARDPNIALERLKSKREERILKLKQERPELHRQFCDASTRRRQAAKVVKFSGIYSELNTGKLNIYKTFVERSCQLVNARGMVGLLTPIGIGTDHNVSKFVKRITKGRNLKAFIAFENRRRWLFKDVHAEDQPTVFIMGGASREFETFEYAVKLHQLPSGEKPTQPVELSRDTLKLLNPNTGTMPIVRTMDGLSLLLKTYNNFPIFIERPGRNECALFAVKYRQMINMTSRSRGFRTKKMLTEMEGAWPVNNGRYESSKGLWLPLYEGKMVSLYNHRYASVRNSSERISGQGVAIHSKTSDLQDPDYRPHPRYWILESDAKPDFPYAIGFNDICNTNNARSLICAIVPSGAYGNKLPILTWEKPDGHQAAKLQANLACIFTDYLARQKIQSRSLSKYILAQLPLVPHEKYGRKFGDKSAADIIDAAVLELSYTSPDLAPFAKDLGHVDKSTGEEKVLPPFTWNEERRFMLRAKLDAMYFILYGVWDPEKPLVSRKEVEHVYSTFPVLERNERERYEGRYRSLELALLWISALMAGKPDADIRDDVVGVF